MASPTSQSTGLRATAGTLLYQGKNICNGILCTAGCTATVYDNAVGDNSGNVVVRLENPGTTTLDILFNIGVRVDNGLSLVTAGGNGAIVYFGGN